MGKRAFALFLLAASWTGGCGPATTLPDNQQPEACPDGVVSRCDGNVFVACDGTQTTCPAACSASVGCTACSAEWGRICQSGDSYACTTEGTVGERVESCGAAGCDLGVCNSTSSTCVATGVKLIYVVDTSDNLWSFDPSMGNKFTLIGRLACPTVVANEHPFSMSVSRDGMAWILYTNQATTGFAAHVFKAKITDASCTSTGFVSGTSGYELFGMGFSTDTPNGNTEKLYIAGGPKSSIDTGLGSIALFDTQSMGIATVGSHYTGDRSPELSGRGDAKLYAFYPGEMVAEINKADGKNMQSWPTTAGVDAGAWAFAQWGGKFYIFVTEADGFTTKHRVYTLDPATGEQVKIIDNSGKKVVGAGVSTCAPIVISKRAPQGSQLPSGDPAR